MRFKWFIDAIQYRDNMERAFTVYMERLDNVVTLWDAVMKKLPKSGCGEAISFIHRELREDGWKGLGNLSEFGSTLESLGFTLTYTYTKGTQFVRKTTVTLGVTK
jgi:hypothetical protein